MEAPDRNDKNMYFRAWGVRTKLLLSFVLLTVVSTGVFLWISYSHSLRMAEENMSQKIGLLASVFSEEIRSEINNTIIPLEDIAEEPAIKSLEISMLFKSFIKKHLSHTNIDAVFIYDADKNILDANYYDERAFKPHEMLAESRAVDRAMREKKTVVFTADSDYSRPGVFFVATPIIGDDGDAAGVVIGEKTISSSTMEKVACNEKLTGGDMQLFIIDAGGKIITHTDIGLIGRSVFDGDMPLALLKEWFTANGTEPDDRPSRNFSFTDNGKRYVGTVATVGSTTAWRVVLVQPYALAIESGKKLRNTLLYWGFLALAVSIYLALYRSRRIIKPISELIQAVEEISRGHYTRRVHIYRRDEFGWLATVFNRMSADLETKIEALQVSQNQLEEAFNQLQNDARKRDEANRELSRKVKELTSLSEVTQTITTSLDLKEVLNTIVDTITRIVGIDICSIKLLDKTTNTLKIEISRGLGKEYLGKGDTPFGEGVSGLTAKMCKPIIIDDVKTDPRVKQDHILINIGVKSIISIPLITKQSVMGVLNLYTREKHEFTVDEQRLLGIFANQAAGAIENARLFDSLRDSYLNTIQALSMAIDAKDRYTHGHSKRVSEISVMIGRAMGLNKEQIELLEYASDLHDIGKIGISEMIIGKESKLTVDEYEIIKTHPLVGETIIEPVPFLQDARPIIRHHHERYDGYGYPDGLKGDEIPLLARIIHIADAYDAMTSDRPYRKALTPEMALIEIGKHSGTQFDPKAVEAFLKVFDSDGRKPVISV